MVHHWQWFVHRWFWDIVGWKWYWHVYDAREYVHWHLARM